MTAADEYVKSVLEWMPRTMSRRVQIGTELQGHIAERVAAGHPIAEVLRQLGDPVALAESYLAEVPLIPAPLGKRLFGLRVVKESGAQIGLGQSIVRQLPAVLQVYLIDAMFVLFTDKRQRAFEMLSKTRVVVAAE